MAHYGMVADHLQDLHEQASPRIYEPIMNSAEGYLQMWERSIANDNTDYHNPLELYVRVVNWGNGKCIDVPGEDNNVTDCQKVQQYDCLYQSDDQQWFYDPKEGSVRSKLNWNKCVAIVDGNTDNNTPIIIRDCNGEANQQWDHDGGYFRSRLNANKVLDANGNSDRSEVTVWDYNSGANQRWRTVLN
jgi:hypothetical protein